MADIRDSLNATGRWIATHRGLLVPIVAASLVFVILVPLPPLLMDILLAANLALAAMILLTSIYVSRPLDFSVFPSLLLGVTLIRLVLNVASTRLILTAGADGRTLPEAQHAAGHVIWSFSQFVTSGSLAVGLILFVILIVIQFIVITRGAARISEVAARFVLDAMPGKQMAIDADLNAELITTDEALSRRSEVAREADFYGAMDGASRFLRGDAVAALIITLVNILGGCYVGMVQYGWSWPQTAELFTRLTIGDGLVTQIPAFIVAVSAALIVTRPAGSSRLGEEVVGQLISRPVVLVITAVFLTALAMTSLPKLPLLALGAGCAGLAWVLTRSRRRAGTERPEPAKQQGDADEEDLHELMAVEAMGIEMGYTLVGMVDPDQDGELLGRIAALRRQIASELGLLVPPIKIRDNLQISAHSYVIRIRGAKVASGRLYPKQLLAVASERPGGKLIGRETTEPAFGAPAVWINPSQRDRAEEMNYAVVTPAGVLMTHLAEVVRRHAPDLLTREQVVKLLDNLKSAAASLVGEVTEKVETARIQKVLQSLLGEQVPIRDLETILEAVSEAADMNDIEQMTEHVRGCLARTLSQQYAGRDGKLRCVRLDATLEETLNGQYVSEAHGDAGQLNEKLVRAVGEGLTRLKRGGYPPVVLCSPPVRTTLRRLLMPSQPNAAVLAYNEIDSVEVEPLETVGVEA